MKLSACMITKNEEMNIALCIEKIQSQVDEIIVVDTESTDKTIELAQANGAKVFSYQWQGDFSAARNFALRQAQGEWILFLDADEFINFSITFNLREKLLTIDKAVDAILIKLINIDVDQNNQIIDYFYTVRLFRNNHNLAYQGEIHEQLQHHDKRTLNLACFSEQEAYIEHTGYSTKRVAQKCKRNLKLLTKEILKGKESRNLYWQIAESYAALDKYEQALSYLRKTQEFPRENTTYQSRYYHIYLVTLRACNLYHTAEYQQILQQALIACKDLPDFHAEQALKFYEEKKYQAAEVELTLALNLQENYQGMEPSFFHDKLEMTKELHQKIRQQLTIESKKNLVDTDSLSQHENSSQDFSKLADTAMEFLTIHLQEMYVCLLALDCWETAEPYAKELPKSMYAILFNYYQQENEEEVDWSLHKTLGDYLEGKVEKKILLRYRAMNLRENGEQ